MFKQVEKKDVNDIFGGSILTDITDTSKDVISSILKPFTKKDGS